MREKESEPCTLKPYKISKSKAVSSREKGLKNKRFISSNCPYLRPDQKCGKLLEGEGGLGLCSILTKPI